MASSGGSRSLVVFKDKIHLENRRAVRNGYVWIAEVATCKDGFSPAN
jgi:hypothetical protein